MPVGTTFSFTLDQARAGQRSTFRHAAEGRTGLGQVRRQDQGQCRQAALYPDGSADGALRVQAKAGTNRLRFEGRISATKKLKTGTFSVVLTARRSGAGRLAAEVAPLHHRPGIARQEAGMFTAVAGFDAVFVGSGVNSLACAALLSRAGWRVCVLERNDVLGGAIRTAAS